jgi:EXS family
MVAYSLRTWRRNGVACDELLFLPGTPHGESTVSNSGSDHSPTSSQRNALRNEGDVAAGGIPPAASFASQPQIEMGEPTRRSLMAHRSASRARSLSGEGSLSSINEFVNQWEDEEDVVGKAERGGDDGHPSRHHRNDRVQQQQEEEDLDEEEEDEEQQLRQPLHQQLSQVNQLAASLESTDLPQHRTGNGTSPAFHTVSRVERFRENHPNVTRIGSFFFFRSSTSTTHSAAYAPSGPSVVGAAIDLSMPVLFNFHLFIEAWNHLGDSAGETGGDTPAKILPLIFLTVLIVRSFFPPGRRGRFWATMKITAMAPWPKSRFPDSYIGDLLTSLVRPLQDVVFALAYYVTVIYGSVTAKYDLTESGLILESSWWLHEVVLPTVALLPLWWRFLQTLREAYDSGQRWPHLGNAFKYGSAGLVVVYAMTHDNRSVLWFLAFFVCLAYQIFWDTVMDWDLFVMVPLSSSNNEMDGGGQTDKSRVWLRRGARWIHQWQIRPRRLYKSEAFYWKIFAFNTAFRFCWMLSFIPTSKTGTTSDTHSYVGVLLPIAEIVRRMVWGFLYLEIHTIQMSSAASALLAGGDGELVQCAWPPERSRLWLAELTLWAVAFVLGGIWASS